MTQNNKNKQPDPFLRSAAGLGTQLMVAIGGFAVLGYKADEKFETKPLGLIFGLILAFTYGGYEIWKVCRILEKNKEDRKENDK